MIALPAAEGVLDASGIALRAEALLPSGARTRQLAVRTLLLGMLLALADGRPAHLTRVHQALVSLPEGEQRRLGVLADWKGRPHPLTCRQAEYTFSLAAAALGKDQPDGLPSPALQAACDGLLEASVPEQFKDAGRSLAADWSDLETFSRPPPRGTGRARPGRGRQSPWWSGTLGCGSRSPAARRTAFRFCAGRTTRLRAAGGCGWWMSWPPAPLSGWPPGCGRSTTGCRPTASWCFRLSGRLVSPRMHAGHGRVQGPR
jgi:hypothetical protein